MHVTLASQIMITSGHNFAHVMTAELSWHVQNGELTILVHHLLCVLRQCNVFVMPLGTAVLITQTLLPFVHFWVYSLYIISDYFIFLWCLGELKHREIPCKTMHSWRAGHIWEITKICLVWFGVDLSHQLPTQWKPPFLHAVTYLTACASGINTLRQRQNGRQFPDNIFKWFFFNEHIWISIKVSLNFVPNGLINNIPALV